MNQKFDGNSGESTFRTIAFIILIAIIVIAAILVFIPRFFQENEDNTPVYITSFRNYAPEEAYDLMNNAENLTIIDCRGLEGCNTCQFKAGHLPGAELNENPNSLFNSTEKILVYSKNGSVGADFCADLVGHVYGDVYNLEGGYAAWDDCYICPVETGL